MSLGLGRMTIVIEDTGMDSGCIHDILEECTNHGRVLSAKIEGFSDRGDYYNNDLMHFFHDYGVINDGAKMGRC